MGERGCAGSRRYGMRGLGGLWEMAWVFGGGSVGRGVGNKEDMVACRGVWKCGGWVDGGRGGRRWGRGRGVI